MKVIHVDNGIKLQVVRGVKGDSIVWKGEWSAEATYDQLHAVSRGGASWISLQNKNIGHDPLTDNGTWWECMVADSLAEDYRDEAFTFRNEAEGFAGSAASSAESAATSASNALESANSAEVYKNEAQYWANIAQDVVFTAEMLQRLETMGGILI